MQRVSSRAVPWADLDEQELCVFTSTAVTDRRPHTALATSPAGTAEGTPSSPGGSALELRMHYGTPPVLSATGEVDSATTPQLAELLWSRLQSTLPALVLDLSAVRFLGLTGVELLARAHSYAHHRGIVLNIVNNTRCVDRALLVSGLDTTLPCFASVTAASTAARQAGSAGTTEPAALPETSLRPSSTVASPEGGTS